MSCVCQKIKKKRATPFFWTQIQSSPHRIYSKYSILPASKEPFKNIKGNVPSKIVDKLQKTLGSVAPYYYNNHI